MDELFVIPPSKSPKQAWLEKHELTVTPLDEQQLCQGKGATLWALGESEEDALVQWAIKNSTPLWNETGIAAPMAKLGLVRPTGSHPLVVRVVAHKLALQVKEWCNDDTSLNDIVKDLEGVLRYESDGYELAKDLESNYTSDAALVESWTTPTICAPPRALRWSRNG